MTAKGKVAPTLQEYGPTLFAGDADHHRDLLRELRLLLSVARAAARAAADYDEESYGLHRALALLHASSRRAHAAAARELAQAEVLPPHWYPRGRRLRGARAGERGLMRSGRTRVTASRPTPPVSDLKPCAICGRRREGPVMSTVASIGNEAAVICIGCLLAIQKAMASKEWLDFIDQDARDREYRPTPLFTIRLLQRRFLRMHTPSQDATKESR